MKLDDPTSFGGGRLFDNLGFQLSAADGEEVVLTWTADERHLQPYGIVHGGVYCAAIESAASLGGALWLGERGKVVGASNQTDFLRAVPAGTVLTARATPIHRGRSQQLWQVVITDGEQRLISRGQVRLANLYPD